AVGGVNGRRHTTRGLDADIGEQPFRPVFADEPNAVAVLEPQGQQSVGDQAHAARVFTPRDGLPQAVHLVAHGHPVPPAFDFFEKKAGPRGFPARRGLHVGNTSPSGRGETFQTSRDSRPTVISYSSCRRLTILSTSHKLNAHLPIGR